MIERIAQRIGMERVVMDGDVFWWGLEVGSCTEEQLPQYLATGDRPLRIQVAYRMGTGEVDGKWWAADYSRTDDDGVPIHSADGPTPAAAILALAERLEADNGRV